MSEYQFYMAECDANWNITGTTTNLEASFDGLHYQRAKGLNLTGKPRLYTESYADSDKLRVHIPADVTHEPTDVTLSFVFIGDNRYATYDAFVDFCQNKRMAYWDSARKKRLFFFVEDAIQPAEEMWHGNIPYLRLELKVKNVFGKTFDV